MGEAIAEKNNKEKHLPRVRMSDLGDIRQPLTRITFLYPCLWSECRHNLVMPFVSWCAILRTISSVKFISTVLPNSLWPHESQHARPPCASPTPGVYTDLRPSSQWCHPAILSSVIPFSSCPQSFPASVFSNESTLRMRWPKYWSFSFSIIPSKEIPGLIFRMDWLDLLAVQGTLGSLSHTTVQKHQFFGAQLSSQSNSHIHTWPLEKP